MTSSWIKGARRACAALALCAITTVPAFAATVTLSPAAWNGGTDGTGVSSPRDGQFDGLLPAQNINVNLSPNGLAEIRSLWEFVLPPELMAAGTKINAATLTLVVNLETLNGGAADMVVHGALANDATITVDDFEVNNPIAQLQLFPGMGGGIGSTRTYFLSNTWLQTVPGGANSRIGLTVATTTPGTNLRYGGASAQLTIDYTPPVGSPPELTILAPDNNLTFVQGTPITFQGTAFDAQDGDRSWGIQWQSNINGFFGNGGWFQTNQLGVGNHVITATVYDFDGNVAIKTRNLTVVSNVNTPPVVTITAPNNNSTVTDNFATTFTATAIDAEQGSLGSSVQWWLDGTTLLGTSASLSYTVAAGSHTMTARVTDGGGLTGEQTISVNSVTPPPPSDYCGTIGANSTFNYVQTVAINGASNNSGNSGGFAYFPLLSVQLYKGVTNQITLTPSASGATQWWSVWVDLNDDKVFASNELLTQGSSVGTTTRSFFVPNMPDSIRRMRVAMHTNAPSPPCGTVPDGEVEDYSVFIMTPPAPPPPPPSAYCSSRGSSTSFEFIRGTTLAGVARTSNSNGGYADFTTSPAINLARGANAITLTPGFGSGLYSENWRVWVDLNRNNLFESNESLFSGAGSAPQSGQITIPSSALAGNTRLRVQMKYGGSPTQCEQFSYGEVEDYLVNIAP
jgi:hypothetical protein